MNEEKITIDRKTFKTLASETRIDILKSLNQRRKTLSELSKQLGFSVSTVKEHMDSLVEAELVRLKDDGHKWKYYKLTRKGYHILNPGETRIWILLSAAAIGMFFTFYDMLRKLTVFMAKMPADTLAQEGSEAVGAAEPVGSLFAQLPIFHIAILAIFVLIFLVSLNFWAKIKKERKLSLF